MLFAILALLKSSIGWLPLGWTNARVPFVGLLLRLFPNPRQKSELFLLGTVYFTHVCFGIAVAPDDYRKHLAELRYMKQKRLQLKWDLETSNEHGKRTKETVRDYGWYVDDPEAKTNWVCNWASLNKGGDHQSLYISAIELQTFVKAMPKTL
jgi:hypothetical protein